MQYLGQPVAVVVAETREQAFDMAVIVDYEPSPLWMCEAATGCASAVDAVAGQLLFEFQVGNAAATEAAATPTVVAGQRQWTPCQNP